LEFIYDLSFEIRNLTSLFIEYWNLRFICYLVFVFWCFKSWSLGFVIYSTYIRFELVSHLLGNVETFSHLSLTAMPPGGIREFTVYAFCTDSDGFGHDGADHSYPCSVYDGWGESGKKAQSL